MARAFGAVAAFALALAGAACSIAPVSGGVIANYDFGPAPAATPTQPLRQVLLVYDVVAPAWLDSSFIRYRLAYQDAARPQAYADSRWVMSPAALLTGRLRGQLAASGGAGIVRPGDGARDQYALRVELDEFTQIFDAPGKSRAVVRVRASMLGNRSLLAQREFSVERHVETPDAEGGVRALIEASDEAIGQLVEWAVQQVKD
ncbi:MAG TPA: ABC-type transport auxiliary lipoprotein family protein [Burkholderiales bacterium]